MQMYEAREFTHDGKIHSYTFYANDDYTAICTVKIHPFRLNKHEVYKITDSGPQLLTVSDSMDAISLADGFFLTADSRTEEEKQDLAIALLSYFCIPAKYRLKLEKVYGTYVTPHHSIVEVIFDDGEQFKQFNGDVVTGAGRRRIYGAIIKQGGWNGWTGISS